MILNKSYGIQILVLFLKISVSAQHKSQEVVKTDTIYYCNQKIEAVISTDSKNFYHGPVKYFYRNGKYSNIKEYSHGLLNGQSTYFKENGDTSFVETWSQNILNGPVSGYYNGNCRMFKEMYYSGKLHGNSSYQDSAGKPFEGVFSQFYSKGDKYFSRNVNCITGKPEGEVIDYDGETGSIIKRATYKAGIVNGKSLTYKEDIIISSSIYENGKFVKETDSNYGYHVFIYNNFLKQDPDNEHFVFLRALAYLRIGNVNKSLEDLNKTISLNKENYKAYYNRAVILSDSLPKVAMKDFTQTLKIKKDFHLAFYNLGILYYRDSQYKKARDNFESCISIEPHHLGSIHNLSMIYGILGDKNMQEYYKNEFERIKKKNKVGLH